MEIDASISSPWAEDPKPLFSIFGSSSKRTELETPVSKNSDLKEDSSIIETPPTLQSEEIKSTDEVSIGERKNLNDSVPKDEDKNISKVMETPKRISMSSEDFQTPKISKNIKFPSPSPSDKIFSPNLFKTPKNSKNTYSQMGVFSTPRAVSGRIASPFSNKTFEAFKKVLGPEILNEFKRSETEANDKSILESSRNQVDENNDDNDHHNDKFDSDEDNKNDIHNDSEDKPINSSPYEKMEIEENNNVQNEVFTPSSLIDNDVSLDENIDYSPFFSSTSTPSKIFRSSRFENIISERNDKNDFSAVSNRIYVDKIPNDSSESINDDDMEYQVVNFKAKDGTISKFEFRSPKNKSFSPRIPLPPKFSNQESKGQIIDLPDLDDFQIQKPSSNQINFAKSSFEMPQQNSFETAPKSRENFQPSSIRSNTETPISVFAPAGSKKVEFPPIPETPKEKQIPIFVPQERKREEFSPLLETPISVFAPAENKKVEFPPLPEAPKESPIPIFAPQERKNAEFPHLPETPKESQIPVFAPAENKKIEFPPLPEAPEEKQVPVFAPVKHENAELLSAPKTTEESAQKSPSAVSQPVEERIFERLFAEKDATYAQSPVKGPRMKDRYDPKPSEEKQKEEKKTPKRKNDSKEILPKHQLSCTLNKRQARYMLESGELTIRVDGKEFILRKGGSIDLIKGKTVELINNGDEKAIITRI